MIYKPLHCRTQAFNTIKMIPLNNDNRGSWNVNLPSIYTKQVNMQRYKFLELKWMLVHYVKEFVLRQGGRCIWVRQWLNADKTERVSFIIKKISSSSSYHIITPVFRLQRPQPATLQTNLFRVLRSQSVSSNIIFGTLNLF